jgi:predicted MPP superfamily phosphohydrolase
VQHYLINIDNGAKTPYELEVSHQEIPMHGLPKSAEGLVVAHLTDFHAGFGNIQPVHEEVVRQVEAVRPDLILLTGDYVDRRTQEVDSPKQMLETLTALKAPLGKYGVGEPRPLSRYRNDYAPTGTGRRTPPPKRKPTLRKWAIPCRHRRLPCGYTALLPIATRASHR